MKKLYTSKAFLKMAGGRMHSLPFILLRWIRPGHKLQKPSKKSSIDMGKLRPAGQIRPAGSFILASRHLRKRKLSP